MNRHLIIIGCVLFGLILIGCQVQVEPAAVFPTPTLAIDINAERDTVEEIVNIETILQATAVPFDYSKIEEEEEQLRQAEIDAIEKIEITIDINEELSNISPLIYGLALSDPRAVQSLRPSVYSWTGDGTVLQRA